MERALAALPELARRFETYSSALLFDGIPQYLLYEEAAKQVLRVKMATYLTSHHNFIRPFESAQWGHGFCSLVVPPTPYSGGVARVLEASDRDPIWHLSRAFG
eukprot:6884707-Prymnesium_polylepis.1